MKDSTLSSPNFFNHLSYSPSTILSVLVFVSRNQDLAEKLAQNLGLDLVRVILERLDSDRTVDGERRKNSSGGNAGVGAEKGPQKKKKKEVEFGTFFCVLSQFFANFSKKENQFLQTALNTSQIQLNLKKDRFLTRRILAEVLVLPLTLMIYRNGRKNR